MLVGAFAVLGHQAVAAPSDMHDLTALPIDQLLNLEVVTATKIPQKLSDVPASVSVITADDIKHYGYRTLADILRSVRGVYVTYDRNYSYVGTRGSGRPGDFNTRLLIMVDGKRLNDATYDQGAAGTEFPIDVELIERVEFVPGPGSAIYGSSAFFGVVNVITKTGAALAHTELALTKASYGTTRGRVISGMPLGRGKADLLVGVSGFDSRGQDLYFPEFDDAASNHGIANGLDYDRYKRLFAKLGAGGLSLEAYFGRRTKGIPTASYGQQFNAPLSHTRDEYAAAGVSYQAPLSNSLELYASLSANRFRYDGTYVLSQGEAATVNRDLSESRALAGEVRLLSTAIRNHKLIAGAEYFNDSRRQMVNFDVLPYVSYLDIDIPKHGYGLYLQDDIRLSEQFALNAGVRHDHDSEGGNANSPRLALLYQATPQVTFKALFGTAFRSANAYERYYASSSSNKLNPNLRSEHVRTGELSVEYFPTNRFRASASLFQYRVKDLLSLTTDPSDGRLYFSNVDATRSGGVEFETEWLGAGDRRLKASVSFQVAHNNATGEWLTNSPRRLLKLNYSTPLLGDGARAGVEYQVMSRRLGAQGEVGGFGLVNLTLLSRKLGKHVELDASIYNLFDKRYADVPSEEHFDNSDPPRYLTSIAQSSRNWRVLVNYEF